MRSQLEPGKSSNSLNMNNHFDLHFFKILPYYAIAFFLSIYSIYIAAAYLRKPIESFILYQASDPGYAAPPFVERPVLGIHYFSDFQQVMSYAVNQNGYSTSLEFPNIYGPVSVYLFRVLNNFSLLFSITFISILTLSLLSLLMWKHFHNASTQVRIMFIAFFLLLSRPIMLCLDRGNIQGIVVALNLATLYYFYSKKYRLSKIFLVISISLKFYPIFFILIFIKKRLYKDVLQILLSSAVLFVVPLLLISRSNFFDSILGIVKGASIQSGYASSGFSPSGWIIRFLEIFNVLNFSNGSNSNIRNLQTIITFFIVIAGSILYFKLNLNETQQWIYVLVFTSFITPVAWGYNLIWLPFVIQRMLSTDDWYVPSARKILNTYQKYLPLLLSLLLIPYPWIFRGGNRINVGVQELTIFPVFIVLLFIWLKSNAEKRVRINEE